MSKKEENLNPNRLKKIRILRESVGKVTKILAGDNIQVTQAGSNAFVEIDEKTKRPKRINIPVIPDDASEKLINAIQGFIDHEVAHVMYTDHLVGEKAVRDGDVAKFYWNLIEDIFIEREISRQFLGSAHNLSHTRRLFSEKYVQPLYDNLVRRGNATENEFWGVLSVCAMRAWAGHKELQDFMADKWDKIPTASKIEPLIADKLQQTKNSQDCYSLSKEVIKLLFGDQDLKPREQPKGSKKKSEGGDDKDGGSSSKSKSSKGEKDKSKKGKSKKDKSEDEDGDSGDEDEEGQGDAEGSEGEAEDSSDQGDDDESGDKDGEGESGDDSDSDSDDEGDSEGDSEGDDDDSQNSREDDEVSGTLDEDDLELDAESIFDQEDAENISRVDFDGALEKLISKEAVESHHGSDYIPFSREYDQIEVYPAQRSIYTERTFEEVERQTNEMSGPIQRSLERAFVARNRSRWEAGKRSGRLNSAGLSRLLVEDDRVFRQKEVTKTRDVAVSLLIDCSGSMAGVPIKCAMGAAWALGHVLERLKLASEIIGFTSSWGAGTSLQNQYNDDPNACNYDRLVPLYMPIFKTFSEPFGTEQRMRISTYLHNGQMNVNIDGECVRIAGDRLLKRPEPGKTLIVLSDGFPAGGTAKRRLNGHLKLTVDSLQKEGVNTVGIGIMTDAVSRFYPKYTILNNINDLPGTVINELRDAILK